jgi:hypothetical protein
MSTEEVDALAESFWENLWKFIDIMEEALHELEAPPSI